MSATGLPYFDLLYSGSDDPWCMRTRWYEQRKRDLVLASLPARRYGHVFEPGCGTGELTLALASRCQRLLACDFSSDALRIAQDRLGVGSNVTLQSASMPADWPDGQFDLIILSEFAFYLDDAQLLGLQQKALASLAPQGTLLACHWRRPFAERTQSTADIHGWFDRQSVLFTQVHHVEPDFLLDVWSRSPLSVAQAEGFA